MIVVDTTVLCYAVGTEHPLRAPCQRLLGLVRNGDLRASTTVEVLREFVHVRSRRRTRVDAVQVARAYVSLFSPLLTPDEDTLEAGLRLYLDTPALGCFDAVLAATARQGADAVLSADRAFAAVPDLRHVFPDDASIDRLLT
ncbi:type II toxin-antitoxin system VapC family toxin [soil metagenome]